MRQAVLVVAIAVIALTGAAWVASAAEIEGTVKTVDTSGQIVTLEDGTTLVLAATSKGDRQALRPGAHVKASFDEKDGKKMVTMIEVRPGAAPMTPPPAQGSPRPPSK